MVPNSRALLVTVVGVVSLTGCSRRPVALVQAGGVKKLLASASPEKRFVIDSIDSPTAAVARSAALAMLSGQPDGLLKFASEEEIRTLKLTPPRVQKLTKLYKAELVGWHAVGIQGMTKLDGGVASCDLLMVKEGKEVVLSLLAFPTQAGPRLFFSYTLSSALFRIRYREHIAESAQRGGGFGHMFEDRNRFYKDLARQWKPLGLPGTYARFAGRGSDIGFRPWSELLGPVRPYRSYNRMS